MHELKTFSNDLIKTIKTTVPVEDYLDDNDWVIGDRSDILVEEAVTKAQVNKCNSQNRTIPRTEDCSEGL